MPTTYDASPMITQPNREEKKPRLASLGFGIVDTMPGESRLRLREGRRPGAALLGGCLSPRGGKAGASVASP